MPKRENVAGIGFPIIGSDESGKGDDFGPLVSAAVYVESRTAKLLELEGVRDSKNLATVKMRSWQKRLLKSAKINIQL